MQFNFQEITKLILNQTGKSISNFEPVVLTVLELSNLNDTKQQEFIFFGTFSGMFGQADELNTGNSIGIPFNTSFFGPDEAGTTMGIGTMNFPNQMFSFISHINVPNHQITFSGYKFNLV